MIISYEITSIELKVQESLIVSVLVMGFALLSILRAESAAEVDTILSALK